MATKRLKCKCKHKFQDARHGAGIRIHNKNAKDGYKCTVCEDIKNG